MTTDRRNFIYIYKSLYLERDGNRSVVSLSRAKITSTDSFPKTVRLDRRRIDSANENSRGEWHFLQHRCLAGRRRRGLLLLRGFHLADLRFERVHRGFILVLESRQSFVSLFPKIYII